MTTTKTCRYTKELKEKVQEKDGHSNYLIKHRGHKNYSLIVRGGCYSGLSDIWGAEKKGAERIKIFLPDRKDDGRNIRIDYVNNLLNHPCFNGVFHTRSYEEGMRNGFDVNLSCHPTHLRLTSIALRFFWENTGRLPVYKTLKEADISFEVCLAVSCLYTSADGGFVNQTGGHGVPFNHDLKLTAFKTFHPFTNLIGKDLKTSKHDLEYSSKSWENQIQYFSRLSRGITFYDFMQREVKVTGLAKNFIGDVIGKFVTKEELIRVAKEVEKEIG